MSILIQDNRYHEHDNSSRHRPFLSVLDQNGLNFRRVSYNIVTFNINDIDLCQDLMMLDWMERAPPNFLQS